MNTSKLVPYAALLAVALLLTSCESADSDTGGSDIPSVPLADVLEDEDNVFETGMIQTGIIDTLREEGPYTLFLLDNETMTRVLNDAGLTEEEFLQLDNLKDILGYHVAIGELEYPDYVGGATVDTLTGPTLKLRATDQDHAFVNDIRLTSVIYDKTANTNGEYEVIDGLLLPPGVSLP